MATGHRDRTHPLRNGERLGAVCGIEYAAQAIAVHAALGSQGRRAASAGLLAAVRDVVLTVDRLDDIPGQLGIRVEKLFAQGDGAVYRFAVCADARELLHGRISVCRSHEESEPVPGPVVT